MDSVWPLGFVIIAAVSFGLSAGDGNTGRRVLVLLLVAVWGLRLGAHIWRPTGPALAVAGRWPPTTSPRVRSSAERRPPKFPCCTDRRRRRLVGRGAGYAAEAPVEDLAEDGPTGGGVDGQCHRGAQLLGVQAAEDLRLVEPGNVGW